MTVATALSPAVTGSPAGGPARRRRVLRWLLPMAPALVLLALFLAGPILWSVYIAFTNETLTGSASVHSQFVGFDNFTRMFADPNFVNSFLLTFVFVIGSAVIGQNTLGLIIALLQRGRGRVTRSVVNGVVIGAWVMPEIVAAACWFSFLAEDGTLNRVLGISQEWLYTAPMLAVILANVWRGTAFSMLVYSAALSEVPPDLVEAAAVDGASPARRLLHITLPLIRRSIMSNLMLITLQTLASFGLIYALTGGGPGTASQTTPLYMYEQAFRYFEIGYGSAIALVMLVIGALFSLIYLRLIKVEDA
ncbi:putative integral membrane transport protein [[Actinomadura] parvosata subsp. kistnae]|uniref:Amino acid ABC transporter permease n=1 Tax=[Actinomadura] parvosata subsp. kistnae TaxID=1909395 RepID=A0A1U9ZSL0_9ACTN|nr:sugar ABC transporter permease [Nonomuraea sp. ATCC 55076]AQZ60921.1 amino acid ABC transporter permease [Nonomuraea sp. ATCC 55076]SPL90399.1 putative integral membrane transport protein [Actinomadura parvosata subsp. kistnae]